MPENTGDPANFRAELRRQQLARRQALPEAVHARLSHVLNTVLATTLARWPSGPSSLGFCLPMRGEPDLLPAMHTLHAAGWRLSVPVVVARGAPMRFRAWAPEVALEPDALGLPGPGGPDQAPPAIVLLPVVAVDARGYRLGYGGGYFDRTLAALAAEASAPLAVGIGFELARTADCAPQAHDVPLDALVTEAGWQAFTVRGHLDASAAIRLDGAKACDDDGATPPALWSPP